MSLVTQQGQQRNMISPEQRQLMNERKRIKSYISSYERNPQNWSKSMLDQLEMLTAQYQIPFQRTIPTASALRNAGAALGGVVDSAAFGLIPDKWYSSEATRQAANVGKIGGAAAQIAAATLAAPFTGGASIGAAAKGLGSAVQAAKGIKGAANVAKQAAKLGATTIAKGGAGRLASGAIQTGKQTLAPYGAGQGWNWAKNVVKASERKSTAEVLKNAKSAIIKGDNLENVVKGKALTADQIKSLSSRISRKYGGGSGSVEKEYLRQLSTANAVEGNISSVTKSAIIQMANKKFGRQLVKESNVKKALKKYGAKDVTDAQVSAIVKKLKEANITKLKDAGPELMKIAASPSSVSNAAVKLADIDKMGALATAGMGAGAAFSLTDYTPSREELMRQEDPYDPYNL